MVYFKQKLIQSLLIMPRYPSVSSLRRICIDSIVKHLDSVWCSYFVEKMYKKNRWIHIVGPFDLLLPDLCHDIFVTAKELGLLKKPHLHLLIHPFFKKLDCSNEKSETALIVDLAGSKCAHTLERLDLRSSIQGFGNRCSLPLRQFSKAMKSLSNLSCLDLSNNSAIDDDYVREIAHLGTNLKELGLEFTSVSDIGLTALVGNENTPGPCLNIRNLRLMLSNVTDLSVRSALLNLNDLAFLSYADLVKVIFSIRESQPERVFKLTNLTSRCPQVTDDMLLAVCISCPMLNNVKLSTYDTMSDQSLIPLSNFRMKQFSLSDELHCRCIHATSVMLPMLLAQGEFLRSLKLAEVTSVDVRLLRHLCPNLEILSLDFIRSFIRESSDNILDKKTQVQPFVKLKTLELRCERSSEPTYQPFKEDLVVLLGSPALETLSILGCDNLCEDVFTKVSANDDAFMKLEKLELMSCNCISFEILSPLLLGFNPLKQVILVKCENITKSDFAAYETELRKRNLSSHVEISWA